MQGDIEYWLLLGVTGAVCYIDTQILQPRRDRLRLELQRRQMLTRILEKLRAGKI